MATTTLTAQQQVVSDVLVSTYNAKGHTLEWLTERIDIALNTTDERSAPFESVLQTIWMTYSGGTTAANATRRIFEALGRDSEIDPRHF